MRGACLLCAALSPVPAHAEAETNGERALIRFPTSCGDRIVFAARGQLWSVTGADHVAHRLTSGPGSVQMARCSPDGKWVAFTHVIGGSRDVYVVKASGGIPRRLTYRPDFNEWVVAWSADSQSVIFLSAHEDWSGRKLRPYSVPRGGGLPVPLPIDRSGHLSFSQDRKRMIYTRSFTDGAAWKRYQGGQAPDLFLHDFRTHADERLTDWKGTDAAPMWTGNTVYFLSDRDQHRRANIWALDLSSRKTRQVTFFDDYDVDAPSLNNGRITFSKGGSLWQLDLRSERLAMVPVTVPDDRARTGPRVTVVAAQLREYDTDYDVNYSISPDGRVAALAARGEIFTLPLGTGGATNLTGTTGAEEDHPSISPDGRFVAYTTDRSGEVQLVLRPASGGAEQPLTRFKSGFLYKPVWSPDGRWIAIHDAAHRLWLVPTHGGEARQVAYNRHHYMHETDEHDAVFSPDGRWLAYSLSRSNRLRELHLYDTGTGLDTVVSSPMESDYRPAFSGDGRFILFVSDRNDIPIYADRETNAVTVKSGGIYVASLAKGDVPPLAPRAEGQTGARSSATARVPGDVDLAGLMSRVVPLPVEPAKITDLQVRGDRVFYMSAPPPVMGGTLPGAASAVHRLDLNDASDTILVRDPSSFVVSADGSRIVFVRNGRWASVAAEGGNETPLPVAELSTTIVPRDEWREMFFTAWRLERDLYVDADMHGIDWQGVRDHYARLLPLIGSRSDLTWLINQMIGELSGSHLRSGGGDDGSGAKPSESVLLGADYALDQKSGRYRFARIYRGDSSRPDYRAPLGSPGVDVDVGDYLLAVNGVPLRAPQSPDEALIGAAGTVELTIASHQNGPARKVRVLPVSNDESLREVDHLAEKRALVSRLSGGRVAYIGLNDMGRLGMRQFVRQFYPQLGAEALLVDVRGNPGGNIDEILLERLRRTLSGMQTGRDRVPQTQPDQVVVGPKAMLIDSDSASDGEVFPLHFRAYGLGELIGSRTWGGIRGIRTDWTLLDGGTVTASEISFYDTEGQWSVENHGVEPDVPVETTPADVLADRDRPLEIAVERLTRKIGPVPKTLVPPPTGGSYPTFGVVPPTYLPAQTSGTSTSKVPDQP
ncbi:tricorn protease [Sphingomonas guangdongensis]|uniref:Tricorn protease homolog n=1 Tax=Sphingomonas guangdongensis TaxID=1141890 RepID=A0A285QYS7_9SPHN|nr:tricorn protease [Sphingomonas guangdongensis]